MILRLFILSLLLPTVASSQTYQSNDIYINLNNEFILVDGVAFIDYNIKEKYVDLILGKSLHHYEIRKSRKQSSSQRFVVEFKGTRDLMFWNTKTHNALICSFRIAGINYWFKELKEIDKKEFPEIKQNLN